MHPAPSLILFTTLSGLGLGLIAWLGALGLGPGWRAAGLAALALALVGAGVIASLVHLGNPQRFLKAFSQWRSSWLSREAVLVIATLGVFALHAALAVLGGIRTPVLGGIAAALAVATVLATAMIYAQLRAVPRWRSATVPAVFLAAALAGGALLVGRPGAGAALLALLGVLQLADWLEGDRRLRGSGTTMATATGLGGLGRLRQLAPPHSGPNYLLREMVHVVGRRHGMRLRALGLGLGVIAPLGLILLGGSGIVYWGLILTFHITGMLLMRWLFYAQAEHVVGLYYGRR